MSETESIHDGHVCNGFMLMQARH